MQLLANERWSVFKYSQIQTFIKTCKEFDDSMCSKKMPLSAVSTYCLKIQFEIKHRSISV